VFGGRGAPAQVPVIWFLLPGLQLLNLALILMVGHLNRVYWRTQVRRWKTQAQINQILIDMRGESDDKHDTN
jgi:hypothetical protein